MLTEDYVDFSTARLLKEKGFDNNLCHVWYNPDESDDEAEYPSTIGYEGCLPAATLQMAMKWLQEVHNLWIDIDLLTGYKWTWSIWLMNDPDQKMGESLQGISTYKEACEAAIKYCLENLIG